MIKYSLEEKSFILYQNFEIPSFVDYSSKNIDWKTIKSFGEEWNKFNSFNREEIDSIGEDYFDIVPFDRLGVDIVALDVGCGTGRWAKYLSSKVGFIEVMDPSEAIFAAVELLKESKNVRVTHADVDNIPFRDNTFDLVYSLGVLHHIPNTQEALTRCVAKVKLGGYFLVYLYYNLDNRGIVYKLIFSLSNLMRKFISKLPPLLKKLVCELMAVTVYLPLIHLSRFFEVFGFKRLADRIPLSYYKKATFKIIRNDALDRFGTPMEQRFSKRQIYDMMSEVGLINIRFSDKAPYWHAIGQKG